MATKYGHKTAQNWPESLSPSTAPIWAYNEIEISAPAKTIWQCYYDNCSHFEILEVPNGPDIILMVKGPSKDELQLNTKFKFHTFGVDTFPTVQEFQPPYRIGWLGPIPTGMIYHAWCIQELDDNRCRVITEEVQRGFLARLGEVVSKVGLKMGMEEGHQKWLEGLKKMSEKGPPPPLDEK